MIRVTTTCVDSQMDSWRRHVIEEMNRLVASSKWWVVEHTDQLQDNVGLRWGWQTAAFCCSQNLSKCKYLSTKDWQWRLTSGSLEWDALHLCMSRTSLGRFSSSWNRMIGSCPFIFVSCIELHKIHFTIAQRCDPPWADMDQAWWRQMGITHEDVFLG